MAGDRSPVRIGDLFPTDQPVPERMIGRSAEVAELVVALGQGLNQVMGGPRRNGKTTVCEAVIDALGSEGHYTVEVDLFKLSGLSKLAIAIVSGLVANRSGPHRGARRMVNMVERAAGIAAAVATAKLKTVWGPDVEIAFDPLLADRDPRGAFEKALTLMQSVAEKDGHGVVLFMDEFQELASPKEIFGDPYQTTQLMRGILQRSPGVTSLFAGSVAHLMRDLFDDEKRAFYKFGAWRELRPIAAQDWFEGLSARFEEGRHPITEAAARALIAQSEGHTRTTMLLAQQAFLAAVVAGDRAVTNEHAAVAFEMAMRADALALAKDVERLRDLNRHALDICRAIARGQPPYKRGPSYSVGRTIEALDRAGYIEQRGTPGRGGWEVTEPLLRRFLADLP
jgi:hypothetical protein